VRRTFGLPFSNDFQRFSIPLELGRFFRPEPGFSAEEMYLFFKNSSSVRFPPPPAFARHAGQSFLRVGWDCFFFSPAGASLPLQRRGFLLLPAVVFPAAEARVPPFPPEESACSSVPRPVLLRLLHARDSPSLRLPGFLPPARWWLFFFILRSRAVLFLLPTRAGPFRLSSRELH